MPDTQCWIGEWEGRPTYADPAIASQPDSWFSEMLKPIIAEEMSITDIDDIVRKKIDVLDVRPLTNSDTKKVIIHTHTYPHPARIQNMPDRLNAIIRRVKELLELPEDVVCVSVQNHRVEPGDWAKG